MEQVIKKHPDYYYTVEELIEKGCPLGLVYSYSLYTKKEVDYLLRRMKLTKLIEEEE